MSTTSETTTSRSLQEREPPKSGSILGLLKSWFSSIFSMVAPSKPEPSRIKEPTIEAIADYIKSGKCRNIIVMTGAGLSTAAGVPDFRSPDFGLYDRLRNYRLPFPEAVFTYQYFCHDPAPFFEITRQLLPKELTPTKAHFFLKLLNDKGLLLRLYSQNVDILEAQAGVPPEKIIEAHGTFRTSHCMKCKQEYSFEWLRAEVIKPKNIPTCACGGVVKPDVVLFGESLPSRFFKHLSEDFALCDLLIVMGTSLRVQPFAGLIDNVEESVPRLLINLTKCAEKSIVRTAMGFGRGFNFSSDSNRRDVLLLSTCDEGCTKLARLLGWESDLNEIIECFRRNRLQQA